jgi:hypothetical protein
MDGLNVDGWIDGQIHRFQLLKLSTKMALSKLTIRFELHYPYLKQIHSSPEVRALPDPEVWEGHSNVILSCSINSSFIKNVVSFIVPVGTESSLRSDWYSSGHRALSILKSRAIHHCLSQACQHSHREASHWEILATWMAKTVFLTRLQWSTMPGPPFCRGQELPQQTLCVTTWWLLDAVWFCTKGAWWRCLYWERCHSVPTH